MGWGGCSGGVGEAFLFENVGGGEGGVGAVFGFEHDGVGLEYLAGVPGVWREHVEAERGVGGYGEGFFEGFVVVVDEYF